MENTKGTTSPSYQTISESIINFKDSLISYSTTINTALIYSEKGKILKRYPNGKIEIVK